MLLLTILISAGLSAEPPMHCGTSLFEHLKQGKTVPLQPLAQQALVEPGDQRLFWIFDMGVMPPTQIQRMATCRGVGNHCNIWVEDSSWNAGQMDSADV